MSTAFVALDIETTGLDASRDEIIEIGAVKFTDARVVDKWQSLINPGKRIPRMITQLTGINDRMVANAPYLDEVLPEIDSFVGYAPILGHNVQFDVGFFKKHKTFLYNETIDTYEIASILLPSASRYNLNSLTQILQIALPGTHRALDDALATHGVFAALQDLATRLPTNLIAEIVRLSEQLEAWDGYRFFSDILSHRTDEIFPDDRSVWEGPPFIPDAAARNFHSELEPEDVIAPLNKDEVLSVFEHGGALSNFLGQFEHRHEQIAMVEETCDALSYQKHVFIEAGTGIGKSFAYLVPAAFWAKKNHKRVLVSTNTINLQDQIINKDIPTIIQALDMDINAIVLKGRANYICPRKLNLLRKQGPGSDAEMRMLGKILVWQYMGGTGDRTEINLNGPVENDIWLRLSSSDELCTSETCSSQAEICPFHYARMIARSAHIIVVNHALLLADVATNNQVLPEYDYLILDEAHHLESATTNALSFRANMHTLQRRLRELGGEKSGILGRVLKICRDEFSPSDYASLQTLVTAAADQTFQIDSLIKEFFEALEMFMHDQRDGRPISPYGHQERIIDASRKSSAWLSVEIAWENTSQLIKSLKESLEHISKYVVHMVTESALDDSSAETLLTNLNHNYRSIEEFYTRTEEFVFQPVNEKVYWLDQRQSTERIALHAAPIHIGQLMERHIWLKKEAVILTSATLASTGDFNYIKGRLNAFEADEVFIGSPFDYENSALLYIVNNIPEPGDRQGHQRAVESALISLAQTAGGRMLALFTSYAQLLQTASALTPVLAKSGILVYQQGEGASPHHLLESFKSSEKAVLLGTRSFWEGIDIPGDDLSILAIVKLPFDVPNDPIISARSETFEDPFYQYALPEAILRFRQGFGRLIRTQSDRGVVVVLDKRIISKKYGQYFIDSIPECTKMVGSLEKLPVETAKWLGL